MATLEERLEELIIELGTDWKTFATYLFGSISGTLALLNTTDKSSIVAAINEVEAQSGSGATNLDETLSATQVVITSDTGTDATIPAADTVNAGVMTKAMFDKLTGIEALADVTDAGNVGSTIHGATAKTTPVDADEIAVIDTEAANDLKRMTMNNLATYIVAKAGAGAPALLDTIDEIAAALGDDPNAITTLTTAISEKQASHANLTALAGLTLVADRLPYANGAGTLALTTFTAAARSLLDDATVADMRTTLDVYSKAELGDPDTDLAALYATAKT